MQGHTNGYGSDSGLLNQRRSTDWTHLYLQVSTPTFFIVTAMAEKLPSCWVPKSTQEGKSSKPLVTTSGLVREMVRHLLLTGSSTVRNWRWRQTDA